MNEESLSHELHRVLDASPVPADLFPPGLTARRIRKPRSRWVAVAAVAAALVIFSLTPLGGDMVNAAGEFIMQYTVKLVFVDDPEAASPYPDISKIQPGQTVTTEEQGKVPRQVLTGLLLAEAKQSEPDWPLPTYLAPPDDARVVRSVGYKLGKSDDVVQRGISVMWTTPAGSLTYSSSRTTEQMPQERLEQIRSGKSGITVHTNDPASKVEQKQVTLKGQAAVATHVGQQWQLFWVHEYGSGWLMGSVDLDELLKVAESLPSLK